MGLMIPKEIKYNLHYDDVRVSLRYILSSSGNRVVTFFWESVDNSFCHLLFILWPLNCILSVFSFGVGGLMWIRMYQIMSALIYFAISFSN